MDLEARTRHYYERVDASDLEGVLAWFADDAVYHRPGYPPMAGRAALADFYGGERVIVSGAHDVAEILVEADRVAVRGVFAGTLKDGTSVEVGFADFIRYDAHARAVERRTYFARPAV